jgi:hypothetical protein
MLFPKVAFISGFTLTPYQAFFHDGSPIYAPREAVLQIFLPFIPGDPLSEGITLFESEPFHVELSAQSQIFRLPIPILGIGGIAKIVLRGAYQRQTILGNDFYVCISHASILGVPVNELRSHTVEPDVDNPHYRLELVPCLWLSGESARRTINTKELGVAVQQFHLFAEKYL